MSVASLAAPSVPVNRCYCTNPQQEIKRSGEAAQGFIQGTQAAQVRLIQAGALSGRWGKEHGAATAKLVPSLQVMGVPEEREGERKGRQPARSRELGCTQSQGLPGGWR